MNIKQHEELIKKYNHGKEKLSQQVKDRIAIITQKKAADLTGKKKSYINDLVNDRASITYETLIELAKKL